MTVIDKTGFICEHRLTKFLVPVSISMDQIDQGSTTHSKSVLSTLYVITGVLMWVLCILLYTLLAPTAQW